jgi:purine-nucleoside phosphorylase
MEELRKQLDQATLAIRAKISTAPRIGLILGTGLGGVADSMTQHTVIPYRDIPHFPVSTVASHHGQLVFGDWSGKPVVAMQGRFHLYEGYTAQQISFPIRVLKQLGVEVLIISAATGGLNPHFKAADLMLITDHINLTGHNPLRGPNVDEWGLRFPDMAEPYRRELQELALDRALAEGLQLHRGVYAGVLGPSLETAAETRMLRMIGADAVGMSVVMEVITAVHCGMHVLGVAVITNVNLPDCYQAAVLEDIVATAEQAGTKLMHLVGKVLERL